MIVMCDGCPWAYHQRCRGITVDESMGECAPPHTHTSGGRLTPWCAASQPHTAMSPRARALMPMGPTMRQFKTIPCGFVRRTARTT